MNYNPEFLTKFTGLTQPERKKLENYWFKLSESEKIELEKIKLDLYFQNKAIYYQKEFKQEYSYSCLLLALIKMQKLDPDIRKVRNFDDLTSDEKRLQFERRLARLEEKRQERNSPKKSFIIKKYDELNEMCAIGFSWRQLSSEIARRWSKVGKINETYLRTIMNEEKRRREQQRAMLNGGQKDE